MPQTYTGRLGLDDQAQTSWLTFWAGGQDRTVLMTREPPPPGTGPNGGVSAMWLYFTNAPGVGNGSTVSVQGRVELSPGGNQPLLRVTQA